MSLHNLSQDLISSLPYGSSFLFVHEIEFVNEDFIIGNYSFSGDEYFYRDHFYTMNILPGVILLEMMGQIGMVTHLSFLTGAFKKPFTFYPILSNLTAEFIDKAVPGEILRVKGVKKYFRNNTLKSDVFLYNKNDIILARLEGVVKCTMENLE